jgi:hypothetical protein
MPAASFSRLKKQWKALILKLPFDIFALTNLPFSWHITFYRVNCPLL